MPGCGSEEVRNDFVGSVLKIGAKLAAGYSFGFEQDFLGGNIASTKKALYNSNFALVLLQDHLKESPLLDTEEYSCATRGAF
ncbi:MAG: hypothetical protein U5K69_11310 [Balneolaceae bacterium]|nr:hypothetical protein [Balneolaceae bacterium]